MSSPTVSMLIALGSQRLYAEDIEVALVADDPDGVRAALVHTDPAARDGAIMALARAALRRLPVMARFRGAEDWRLLQAAVRGALRDGSTGAWHNAIVLVARWPATRQAREALLVEALSHDNHFLRSWTLRCLGRLAPALRWLSVGLSDPSPEVRISTIRDILPMLPHTPACRAQLRAALSDPAPRVRAAVLTFAPLDEAMLVAGLRDGHRVVWWAALHRATLATPGVAKRVERLHRSRRVTDRAAALRVLVRSGWPPDGAVWRARLATALDGPPDRVWRAAFQAAAAHPEAHDLLVGRTLAGLSERWQQSLRRDAAPRLRRSAVGLLVAL